MRRGDRRAVFVRAVRGKALHGLVAGGAPAPVAHFSGGIETGPDVAALAGGGVDQDEPEALLALMQRGRASDAIRVDVRMGDSPLPG